MIFGISPNLWGYVTVYIHGYSIPICSFNCASKCLKPPYLTLTYLVVNIIYKYSFNSGYLLNNLMMDSPSNPVFSPINRAIFSGSLVPHKTASRSPGHPGPHARAQSPTPAVDPNLRGHHGYPKSMGMIGISNCPRKTMKNIGRYCFFFSGKLKKWSRFSSSYAFNGDLSGGKQT